jgi:hypothetical protein
MEDALNLQKTSSLADIDLKREEHQREIQAKIDEAEHKLAEEKKQRELEI